MKNFTQKLLCLILTLATVLSLTAPAFAAESKDVSDSGITINGVYYTDAEFQELLTYIEPSEDVEPIITPRSALALTIPAWAIGKWVIPAVGAVIITPVAITVGGQIIDSASKTFTNILNAVKQVVDSKDKGKDKGKDKDKSGNKTGKDEKPTGRRVRNVHKRLKKEGFQKATQSGSHEKWVKGDKVVTVPNHGESYEIPTGTLRNIWRQAGWI